MLVFALFLLAAPNDPPESWVFQGQYRTEFACNFMGAYQEERLAKVGVAITFNCTPRQS